MFKVVFLGALVLAAAEATSTIGLDDLENLIEYEDAPQEIMVPFPYRDNGYKPLSPVSYYAERYEPVVSVVPAKPVVSVVPTTNVGFSKLGLVSSVASYAFSLAKTVVSFVIKKIPALIIGTLAVIGVCKCTYICSKLSSFDSLSDVSVNFRSFATPERLTRATEFVKSAIRKYRSIQDD